eukprot:scaffold6882_cov117-Isochrysis_galbana.AAC.7
MIELVTKLILHSAARSDPEFVRLCWVLYPAAAIRITNPHSTPRRRLSRYGARCECASGYLAFARPTPPSRHSASSKTRTEGPPCKTERDTHNRTESREQTGQGEIYPRATSAPDSSGASASRSSGDAGKIARHDARPWGRVDHSRLAAVVLECRSHKR